MATDRTAPERTPTRAPAYLRIADDLRIQIETGDLSPGDHVPSLSELTTHYGVSQAVARQAISLLRSQALITTGQGRRPTVRGPRVRISTSNLKHLEDKRRVTWPIEKRRAHGPLEDTTGLSVHDMVFSADYSRVLADDEIPEFPVETPLLRREYETKDKEGRRLARSTSWLPIALIESNPDLLEASNEPWPGSTQHQLHTVGIEVAEIVATVTARAPTTVEAEAWGLLPGEPLLIGRSVMHDTEGRVVCCSQVQYPADSTQLEFVTPLPKQAR